MTRTATGAEAAQASGSGAKAPVEGEWRCSACGNGEHLYACAAAVVHGGLEPDGSVTEDEVSQTDTYESSIDCAVHPAPEAPLERWLDGCWRRWEPCEWIAVETGWTYRCDHGNKMHLSKCYGTCPACDGAGGFWVPTAPESAAPRGGAVKAEPDSPEQAWGGSNG